MSGNGETGTIAVSPGATELGDAGSEPAKRLDGLDWARAMDDLHNLGRALIGPVLTHAECTALRALYAGDAAFRSRVVMSRHGFGDGEYKYFDYPLPDVVARLRTGFYAHLAPVANRWRDLTGAAGEAFPDRHAPYLARCQAAGQRRPTPLLLRYTAGGYNCLHQDLYGEHVFPLQVTVLLSEPGAEFGGGEFVLTEQRPRMQSRVEVLPLTRGEAVVFAVNERPRAGARGHHRVRMRHGVSTVRHGTRFALGIIFHDAT